MVVLSILKFFQIEKLNEIKKIKNFNVNFAATFYFKEQAVQCVAVKENERKPIKEIIKSIKFFDRKFCYDEFRYEEALSEAITSSPNAFEVCNKRVSLSDMRILGAFSPGIIEMEIRNCKLTDDCLKVFIGVDLSKLTSLCLSENPITDNGVKKILSFNLNPLVFFHLFLRNTKITGKSVKMITESEKLKNLGMLNIAQSESKNFCFHYCTLTVMKNLKTLFFSKKHAQKCVNDSEFFNRIEVMFDDPDLDTCGDLICLK